MHNEKSEESKNEKSEELKNEKSEELKTEDIGSTQIVEDELASSVLDVQSPVVVENGWTRVGPQSVTIHEFNIRPAPSDFVHSLLKGKPWANCQASDAKSRAPSRIMRMKTSRDYSEN